MDELSDNKNGYLSMNVSNSTQNSSNTERLKIAIEMHKNELEEPINVEFWAPNIDREDLVIDKIDVKCQELSEIEKKIINNVSCLFYFSRSIHHIDLSIETKLEELKNMKNKRSFDKIKVLLANFLATPIKRVVTFAKTLPDFCKLNSDDQLNLVQAGTLEITICSSSSLYDPEKNTLENIISKDKNIKSTNNSYIQLDKLRYVWNEDLFNKTIFFLKSMKELNLDETSLSLFLVLILFSPDRRNLNNREKINEIQSKYSFLLQKYMNWKLGTSETTTKIYNKLLLKLSELRELSELHSSLLLDADVNKLEPFPLAIITSKKDENCTINRNEPLQETVQYEL